MEKLKKGDIVKLISGGPEMVVEEVGENGEVNCQWFSGSKLQDGIIQSTSLKKVEKKDE